MMQVKAKEMQARCVLFLDQDAGGPPVGRSVVMWLPAAVYTVEGEESIYVTSRDQTGQANAFRLVAGNGATYYVHKHYLDQLERVAEVNA